MSIIIQNPISTASVVSAVASLACLYLLYKMSQSSASGFASYACSPSWNVGSSAGQQFGAVRDDTGSLDLTRTCAGFKAGRSGYKPRVLGGFNANMEPPVFWNPGSYAAVGNAQHDGIAAEGTGDDGTAWDAQAGDDAGDHSAYMAPTNNGVVKSWFSAHRTGFANPEVPAPY